MELVRDFPLFPLGLVALPGELVPLHVFEERYKAMVGRCLAEGSEFGIVWVSDDGLREVGCACEIAEILETTEDGRINLIARGTRVFRVEARQEEFPYPAGTSSSSATARRTSIPSPRPRRGRPTPSSSSRRRTRHPSRRRSRR
jgi:Lon protease-like protein